MKQTHCFSSLFALHQALHKRNSAALDAACGASPCSEQRMPRPQGSRGNSSSSEKAWVGKTGISKAWPLHGVSHSINYPVLVTAYSSAPNWNIASVLISMILNIFDHNSYYSIIAYVLRDAMSWFSKSLLFGALLADQMQHEAKPAKVGRSMRELTIRSDWTLRTHGIVSRLLKPVILPWMTCSSEVAPSLYMLHSTASGDQNT